MNPPLTCTWCSNPIDRSRDSFVTRVTNLANGHRMQRHYHAKVCYTALVEFLDLHSFQPLDPSTHDHG